jgi:hypothetical protein
VATGEQALDTRRQACGQVVARLEFDLGKDEFAIGLRSGVQLRMASQGKYSFAQKLRTEPSPWKHFDSNSWRLMRS